MANIKNTKQGKTAIEGFFNAAVSDTTAVVTKLKDAGTPNVTNGKQISTALVSSFSQIETALAKGKTAAGRPTHRQSDSVQERGPGARE